MEASLCIRLGPSFGKSGTLSACLRDLDDGTQIMIAAATQAMRRARSLEHAELDKRAASYVRAEPDERIWYQVEERFSNSDNLQFAEDVYREDELKLDAVDLKIKTVASTAHKVRSPYTSSPVSHRLRYTNGAPT